MRTNARSADPSALDTVQKAAAQLEQAAEENSAKVASRKGVARVMIERPSFNVRDYLWSGTVGLIGAAGQLTLVAFLTFFALGRGDTFRRKLVKITGPSLQKKKITVHVLDDITGHIERYLLVQILTSAHGGRRHRPRVLGDRPRERGGLGHRGRGHQPDSLHRLGDRRWPPPGWWPSCSSTASRWRCWSAAPRW